MSSAVGSSYHDSYSSSSLSTATTVQPQITSLGKRAVFKLSTESNNDWKHFESNSPLCKKLKFVSETEGSFFQSFTIQGITTGDVYLLIHINATDTKSFNYLVSNKLADQFSNKFSAKTPETKEPLFTLLKENNDIPSDKIDFITTLIYAKSWFEPDLEEAKINNSKKV
jgi:hypothetical protein